MKQSLWTALELIRPAEAVLAEWQILLGNDFSKANTFLCPTDKQALSYPCINRPACECHHSVIVHSLDNIVAVCQCEVGGCPSFSLEPKDLIIYTLDVRRFAAALRVALNFDAPDTSVICAASGTVSIGTFGIERHPVFFHAPHDEGDFLRGIAGLYSSIQRPFILLTPTRSCYSETVMQVMTEKHCALIPLSMCLSLDAPGRFAVTESITPILEQFKKALSDGKGLQKTIERVDRNLEAVAKQNYHLNREVEELRRLQAEGFLNFVSKIDALDFKYFAAIMLFGNRKAAADQLDIPHRTFYDRVNAWKSMDKRHQRLFRLVEWRKKQGQQYHFRLEDSLLGSESDDQPENPEIIRDVLNRMDDMQSGDYTNLFQDMLEALHDMHGENWNSIRAELIEILEEELPQ